MAKKPNLDPDMTPNPALQEFKQSLSKDEKQAKNYLEIGFKQHDGPWMKQAKRLKEFYQGKYYNNVDQRQRFIVNTVFSLVNLMLPSLVYNQPHIDVKPLEPNYNKELVDGEYQQLDNIRAAGVRESAINHLYTKIKALKEQRAAIQDSFYYGFGVTKTGYSYETSSYNDKDYIVKDTPFLRRVNPADFGWHPLASDIYDSVFLIHRTLTTKDQLKKIDRYKNIDKLVPEIPVYLKNRYKNTEWIKTHDFVPIYEVHDQSKDKIYTFGGSNKILLDKMDNPYKFDGPHFDVIRFAFDNDKFEGVPLLGSIEDEAIALNEILTLMVEHYRKFPGALYVEEGTLDDDDIQRIRNGEQGSIHVVGSIDKIKFQPPLSMGQEYFQVVNVMQSMHDRILGIPDFQRMGSTTRKSATEAALVQGDVSVRRQYMLLQVKEFMLSGIQKLATLQAQFQDEKELIQASGDLQGSWIEFDKTDLQGKWRFDFDLNELQADNQLQVQSLTSALQILSQQEILHPILLSLNPNKIAKQIFNGLGLMIESVQDGQSEYAVFVKPEVENDMARKGKPMPAPKQGEAHKWHLQVHMDDLKTKGWNEQIAGHIASTMVLEEQEKNGGQPPQQTQQPQQPQMPGMAQGGVIQGPMQIPGQTPGQ